MSTQLNESNKRVCSRTLIMIHGRGWKPAAEMLESHWRSAMAAGLDAAMDHIARHGSFLVFCVASLLLALVFMQLFSTWPVVLDQQAELPRHGVARLCREWPFIQYDCTGCGGAQAGQGVQQAGFAGAVAAQQRPALAGLQAQVQTAAEALAADLYLQPLRFQQAHASSP